MMKYAKKIAGAALTALALCGVVSAQPAGSPVALHGQLSVNGNKIVDKNGDPVQLRGMSFFWAQWSEGSRFYNSGVVNTLADDWKVSVIRAAHYNSPNSLTETVVDAAIEKGIYVIIDWHSHTANTEPSNAKTFFQAMATKYKGKPNIIYEIFNEPIEQSWSTIKTYANEIVPAIRAIDDKNIILIGTRDYSKRVDEPAKDPVSGTNLAYVAHFYAAQEGHGDEIRGWIRTALNAGRAVFVSEFGTCEASGGGKYDFTATDKWFTFLDQYQISWANWSVSDKSEAASVLNGGASTTGGWSESNYTSTGKYIRDKLRMYASSAYKLNVTVTGNGTVVKYPDYETYTYGMPVTLIAKPGTGNELSGWGGDVAGKSDTVVVSMTAAKTVTATFGQAGNLITNGSFVSSISPWQVYASALADPFPDATLAFENSEGKITMKAAGSAIDHAYIYQRGISLKKGRKYELSFTARAAASRNIAAKVVVGSTVLMAKDFTLSTSKESFTATFDCNTDATDAALRFCFGGAAVNWYITDITLKDIGQGTTAVRHQPSSATKTAWSLYNVGGTLQLRGPIEAGAKVSLYNTRGMVVRSMAVKDGMALNAAGIPAGSYLAVVKNRAGAEVYKTRVSFVR